MELHRGVAAQLLGRFNGFLKSVILRVSEARDLGDVDRFAFYDHMKAYTAAPPDVLRVDEKNIREYSVLNVCGVIITTNHKTDGIYLPADDRRHFVAWSDADARRLRRTATGPSLYHWFEQRRLRDRRRLSRRTRPDRRSTRRRRRRRRRPSGRSSTPAARPRTPSC